MPTRDELTSLAHDHMAVDLLTDEAVVMMSSWSLAEAEAYFESGGSDTPSLHRSATAPTTLNRPSSDKKRLLCLHSSAASGSIFRRQLAPLKLEESFDLDFLDGTIVIDPETSPEAKMLRKFFPKSPNLTYMRRVMVDAKTGVESDAVLATNEEAWQSLPPEAAAAARDTMNTSIGEYREIEPALKRLSATIASASQAGARYDGCLAFSQGANLLSVLLAVLEAAEAAAAAEEAAAAALPAGPEKQPARLKAMMATELALRRSRILRPPFAVMFCASDFGWMAQLTRDEKLSGRCLAALDAGLVESGHEDWSGVNDEKSGASSSGHGEAAVDVSEAWSNRCEEKGLSGVFFAPLANTKLLVVLGLEDGMLHAGRHFVERCTPSSCTVIEHTEGHKVPSAKDQSVVQRIRNFAIRGVADEIIAGGQAFYKHRTKGWLKVKVTKVDYMGACEDGGATYCITAPELDGEVETVRQRLSLSRPDGE